MRLHTTMHVGKIKHNARLHGRNLEGHRVSPQHDVSLENQIVCRVSCMLCQLMSWANTQFTAEAMLLQHRRNAVIYVSEMGHCLKYSNVIQQAKLQSPRSAKLLYYLDQWLAQWNCLESVSNLSAADYESIPDAGI